MPPGALRPWFVPSWAALALALRGCTRLALGLAWTTLCGCHALGTPGTCPSPQPTAAVTHLPEQPGATLDVYFLQAGGGDAAVIDYGDVEMVIDGGSCHRCLTDFLLERGLVEGPPRARRIELVILSHADPDHYKGLRRLARDFVIDELWDPGYRRGRALVGPRGYHRALASLKHSLARSGRAGAKRPLQCHHRPIANGNPSFRAPRGDPEAGVAFEVGSTLRLRLLHAEMAPTTQVRGNGVLGVASREAHRINNSSIVVALEYRGGRQVLFTGDINGRANRAVDSPAEVEAQLLAQSGRYLPSDVLKVPHHGSDGANTTRFIDAVDPSFAVLMHHRWLRRFGPPAEAVIEQYEARAGTTLLRPREGHPVHCRIHETGARCVRAEER